MTAQILHARRLDLLCCLLLAVVITLAGCAPQTPQPGTSATQVDPARKARDLRHGGELEAAAKEFLRISRKAKAPRSLVYRLHAAETYLEAQQIEPARAVLADFPRQEAGPDLQSWALVLDGRAALQAGDTGRALELLDAAAATDTGGTRARDIHELRAQILLQMDRPLEAIAARTLMEPLLGDQAEIDANRQTIWNIATAIPADQIEAQLDAAPENVRGWMELALLAQPDLTSSTRMATEFRQWQRKYPGHPGVSVFTAQFPEATSAPVLPASPQRIALLLPFEGQAANAGSAVRDGLVAAWLADGRVDKPVIEVYNATPANAAQAYDQAVTEGAELVIGPLEKGAAESILRRGEPAQPLLVLNQLSGEIQTATPVVQFGLTPEDEARQVAERAWADGRTRALVMTPADNWGERVFRAFEQHWLALGGVVMERVTYSSQNNDFVTPVKQLLDIDDSEQRSAELHEVVDRELITAPHPRTDADVLFLAAYSLQARQIQPQLLFFGARDLPVYATSHVYAGTTDVARDTDLNGIVFGDMPCIVVAPAGDLGTLMNANRADSSGSYTRLFAMGVDAYRMVPQLAAMHADPAVRYRGETGELSMGANGQVLRRLSWARFLDGTPVPLDAIPGVITTTP